jgi:hypothetical protein
LVALISDGDLFFSSSFFEEPLFFFEEPLFFFEEPLFFFDKDLLLSLPFELDFVDFLDFDFLFGFDLEFRLRSLCFA